MDKEVMQVPINRSYWVVAGKFLAGCYPGSKDIKESESRITALVQIGIRHVISLMEPEEYNNYGKPFAPYVDQMEAIAQDLKRSVTFDQLPYATGAQYQWSDRLSTGAQFVYADYGKAKIDNDLLKGDYKRNDLFFFALNANWKF